jgi:hypothetical protein
MGCTQGKPEDKKFEKEEELFRKASAPIDVVKRDLQLRNSLKLEDPPSNTSNAAEHADLSDVNLNIDSSINDNALMNAISNPTGSGRQNLVLRSSVRVNSSRNVSHRELMANMNHSGKNGDRRSGMMSDNNSLAESFDGSRISYGSYGNRTTADNSVRSHHLSGGYGSDADYRSKMNRPESLRGNRDYNGYTSDSRVPSRRSSGGSLGSMSREQSVGSFNVGPPERYVSRGSSSRNMSGKDMYCMARGNSSGNLSGQDMYGMARGNSYSNMSGKDMPGMLRGHSSGNISGQDMYGIARGNSYSNMSGKDMPSIARGNSSGNISGQGVCGILRGNSSGNMIGQGASRGNSMRSMSGKRMDSLSRPHSMRSIENENGFIRIGGLGQFWDCYLLP